MSDDTIYRQVTIDALDALCDRECEYSKQQRSVMCGACRLGSAFDVIDELPSAQPEHTETHSCDYQHTVTHDWIPVTERQPYHELAIVQYSDGDFDLLQFPTAYRWKDIVAWMPLPEPYKGGQDD